MKTLLSKLMLVGIAGILIGSCKDNDTKAVINPTSSVSMTMNATVTTVVLDSTNAKTTTATVISWTAAKYGANLSVDYTVEADTTNAFTKPVLTDLGSYILTQTYTKRQ